jgi:hypothetical protein
MAVALVWMMLEQQLRQLRLVKAICSPLSSSASARRAVMPFYPPVSIHPAQGYSSGMVSA